MLRALAFSTILGTSVAGLIGLPWWVIGLSFVVLSLISYRETTGVLARSDVALALPSAVLQDALATFVAVSAAYGLGASVGFVTLG